MLDHMNLKIKSLKKSLKSIFLNMDNIPVSQFMHVLHVFFSNGSFTHPKVTLDSERLKEKSNQQKS